MFERYINDIFSDSISRAKKDISSQDEKYILNCSYDELVDYFYNKHQLPTINISKEPDYIWSEQTGINAGYIFSVRFYITSGKEMLHYHGSTTRGYLGGYVIHPSYNSDFLTPKLEWYEFNRTLTLTEVESILSSDEKKEKFEKQCFSSDIDAWLFNISVLNNEINSFNNRLLNSIRTSISNIISVVSRKIEVRNKLKIGVMPISDIRNKKVEIQMLEKKEVEKPVEPEPYYYISEEDYDLIIQIISRCMIQYERTPMTFENLGEEDIRNIIIGAVNANFEFSSSAESFSNTGHTDIMILAKNKAAFIAECKLWNGAKYVSDGIEQLLGYTTYKDGKLALLVFNKENKDYNNVLFEMEKLITSHNKYIQTISKNGSKWVCLFKSNHTGTVKISFIVSNYHFEK